jgi:hypothetical protein
MKNNSIKVGEDLSVVVILLCLLFTAYAICWHEASEDTPDREGEFVPNADLGYRYHLEAEPSPSEWLTNPEKAKAQVEHLPNPAEAEYEENPCGGQAQMARITARDKSSRERSEKEKGAE